MKRYRDRKPPRFGLNFEGKIASDYNSQMKNGVKRGTRFRIRGYATYSEFHYVVDFLPKKKFKHLNEQGPFIKDSDIRITKAMEVLFGR